jgi:hypothetical protein
MLRATECGLALESERAYLWGMARSAARDSEVLVRDNPSEGTPKTLRARLESQIAEASQFA